MIWELGLLAPKGMILVDNALFFGDPYTKEGYMGKAGEGITSFNDIVREDGNVHKVLFYHTAPNITLQFYTLRRRVEDVQIF